LTLNLTLVSSSLLTFFEILNNFTHQWIVAAATWWDLTCRDKFTELDLWPKLEPGWGGELEIINLTKSTRKPDAA
jgi:hypothetical protein